MNVDECTRIAKQLSTPGKGILAADESVATLTKRFDVHGISCTPEMRAQYRAMLFSHKSAIASFISGAILFDETISQTTLEGRPLPQLLLEAGALVGIKVDTGLQSFLQSPCEKITRGLDQLNTRLESYKKLGATFAKWRATFNVTDRPVCIRANATVLAEYAACVQQWDMVPIVEPEVLMDGDHTIQACEQMTRTVLACVMEHLWAYNVHLPGIILKPNMIGAGKACAKQASVQECALLTRACLADIVPSSVPGILFLSGGQSEMEATEKLNSINVLGPSLPWTLSFSYGRALQESALKIWAGLAANITQAQEIFGHRARMNALAARGQWDKTKEEMQRGASAKQLEPNHL